MPARPLHALWARADVPPVEWFIGATDVVHGTNFVVPPTRRAAAVVSVHDLTPLHHPELCNEATLAYPGLIRRALDRGAWVHADSAFVADEVVEAFGADPSRCASSTRAYPTCRSDRGGGRRLCGGSFRLASSGSAWPSERPSRARTCPAWCGRSTRSPISSPMSPSCWPGRRAGVSRRWPRPWPRRRRARRIVRTGWVEQPAWRPCSSRASVLAYPSLYEGFGFPPLQAMRAGVPVVATRAGSLPEVLGDAALLVDAGDHEALAEALVTCLGDEEERTRLIAAGTAWSARYSWERCGDGLEALYRDAAAGRG